MIKRYNKEFALLALFIIIFITGGVNLSIVTTSALSGIAFVMVMSNLHAGGTDPVLSIVISLIVALLVALACGLLNAFFVTGLGVAPLLATLGTSSLFEGICLLITKGRSFSGMPDIYYKLSKVDFLEIPLLMWMLIIAIIVAYVLLELTPWGKRVYMVGCNPVATEYSGINIKKVIIKAYIFSAVMSFMGMVVMTIRYNSMRSDYGSSYLMQSITACVLGGVAVNGGYGKVVGVVLAVGVLQILSSGLNIFEANAFLINIIMDVILLATLSVTTILNYFKEKKSCGLKACYQ